MIDFLGFVGLVLMPLISLLNPFIFLQLGMFTIRGIDFLFLIMCNLVFIKTLLHPFSVNKYFLITVTLIGCMVLIAFLGFLFCTRYSTSPLTFLRFLQGMFWGLFATVFIRKLSQTKVVVYAFLVAGSINAAFSCWLALTIPKLHRNAGLFGAAGGEGLLVQASYNEIGAIHSVAAAISFFWLINKYTLQKSEIIFLSMAAFVNLVGLILTQSRSGIFSFGVVMLFVFLIPMTKLFLKGRMSKKYIFFILFFLSFAVYSMNNVEHLKYRMNSTFVAGTNSFNSMEERFRLWNIGTNFWVESSASMTLGHGYGSIKQFTGIPSAHNYFINVLVSTGIIGLLTVLAYLMFPFFFMAKNKDGRNLIAIVLGIAFIVSFTGNVLVDPFYGGTTYLLIYSCAVSSPFYYTRG